MHRSWSITGPCCLEQVIAPISQLLAQIQHEVQLLLNVILNKLILEISENKAPKGHKYRHQGRWITSEASSTSAVRITSKNGPDRLKTG
jgi:hypothetical protein